MICQHTQFKPIEIWTPRYRDKVVLLACHRVGKHNKITFTGDPKTGYNNMGTDPYYISGDRVKKCKKESNGSIDCWAVPISELQPLELEQMCEHLYK